MSASGYACTEMALVAVLPDGRFRVWSAVEDEAGEHIDFDPDDVTGPELEETILAKVAQVPDLIKQWEGE